MKYIVSICMLLLVALCQAQVQVNKSVVLDGGHQVKELERPEQPTEAMNAAYLQSAGYSFCTATGVNVLSANLFPMPTALTPGMTIHLAVTQSNTDSVSLTLNTFPTVQIRKGLSAALDSADLQAGTVVRLVFDGTDFQLLSKKKEGRRPCPTGFIEVNSQYCIEPDERPETEFPDAAVTCGLVDAKLCSWAEFVVACRNDTILGLNGMQSTYEWTDSCANGDDYVRIAGAQGCFSAGTSLSVGGPLRTFRCCYRR